MNEDESIVRLTVKGWLASQVGVDEADILWDGLVDFVGRSMDYEEDRREPAVLLRDGGLIVGLEPEGEEI